MRFVSRLGKALRGKPGRTTLKLVVYSGVCLAVLAYLVGLIGNVEFFKDHDGYRAAMPDATGLLVNDEVKIAGVKVGKVTGIKVVRGQAIVSFQVADGTKLQQGTRTAVRWRNVLGQKYLYLEPDPGTPKLEPGATIPIDHADRSADVGEFLNSVGPILRAIDPNKANAFIRALNDALAGNENKVRDLLSNSASIAQDLGGMDQQVGHVIGSLDTVVGTLADRDADLNTAVTRLSTLARNLALNNDDLQLLVDRFTKVQDQMNRLVTENKTDLEGTIDDLASIATVLRAHRQDLDTALATLPAGLDGYQTISSYGQWFQVRATVTCLANQTSCVNEDSTSGALIDVTGQPGTPSLPTLPTLQGVFGFALTEPGL